MVPELWIDGQPLVVLARKATLRTFVRMGAVRTEADIRHHAPEQLLGLLTEPSAEIGRNQTMLGMAWLKESWRQRCCWEWVLLRRRQQTLWQ